MTEISGQFQISGQLGNFRNFRTAGTPANETDLQVSVQTSWCV